MHAERTRLRMPCCVMRALASITATRGLFSPGSAAGSALTGAVLAIAAQLIVWARWYATCAEPRSGGHRSLPSGVCGGLQR